MIMVIRSYRMFKRTNSHSARNNLAYLGDEEKPIYDERFGKSYGNEICSIFPIDCKIEGIKNPEE